MKSTYQEGARWWDRSRFLVALAAVWLVLSWKVMADHPGIVPFADALRVAAVEHPWIFWLAGGEAVRQAHLLAVERSRGYQRFWERRVFGGFEERSRRRFDDRTRFRLARVLTVVFWAGLLVMVLAAVLGIEPSQALFLAPELLWQAFPVVLVAVLFAGLFWSLSGGVETYPAGAVRTRFADVWGHDHVIERLAEAGGHAPGGVLLWGPPGTGKTMLADAVAGETGMPYVVVSPGALTGALKVRLLFHRLRRLASRHGGAIVLFDGADGPGAGSTGVPGCDGPAHLSLESRSVLASLRREPDAGIPRVLLTELSRLRRPRGSVRGPARWLLGMPPEPPRPCRVLVMVTANRPDAVEELLRCAGIDRFHHVGYPSQAGRVRTYRGYFDKVPHRLTAAQVDRLAAVTPYATGATMRALVDESLRTAVRAGRNAVTWPDVLHAGRLGDTGRVERERHALAVHEACHAVVAYATRPGRQVGPATIEPRAGVTPPVGPEGRFVRRKSEYEADVMVALASLAGERLFFGDDSSCAVAGDLHAATLLTAFMESHWGMGTGLASLPALRELDIVPGGPPGERIEGRLAGLLDRTGELLKEHRRDVLCLAHALETHRTLRGDDVTAILRRREGLLVDGTDYASDEFYRELEEYHAEVARDRDPRALPVAPGRRPPSPSIPGVSGRRSGAPVQGAGVVRSGAVGAGRRPGPAAGGAEPEFVPWTGEGRGRTRTQRLWVVGASLVTLVGVALILGLALNGVLATGPAAGTGNGAAVAPDPMAVASPWLLMALFVVVVAVVVGVGLAAEAVKRLRTARAKADRDRDEAYARAQFLAAALDPDTAMRLLGYDGDGRRETA